MKRRIFVKSSLLATFTGLGMLANASDKKSFKKGTSDFYEWRTYRLKDNNQKSITTNYLEKAFIPALNRMGIKPIGVFEEMEATQEMNLFVLITYPTINHFTELMSKLQNDKLYQQAGAAYLTVPKDKPAYERIESTFMSAFEGIPIIEVPQSKERIFELRRYESYSEYKGIQKVKMFNKGELDVFRKTGLHPVFFGQSLIGEKIPNLTYMIYFKDMEEHDKNWNQFRTHPDWVAMKDLPEYADTVSNITKTFLKPLPFSQV